jgi:hypothetical protein
MRAARQENFQFEAIPTQTMKTREPLGSGAEIVREVGSKGVGVRRAFRRTTSPSSMVVR